MRTSLYQLQLVNLSFEKKRNLFISSSFGRDGREKTWRKDWKIFWVRGNTVSNVIIQTQMFSFCPKVKIGIILYLRIIQQLTANLKWQRLQMAMCFYGVAIGKETKLVRIYLRCMPTSYSFCRSTLLCLMVIHYQQKMIHIKSIPEKQVQLSK